MCAFLPIVCRRLDGGSCTAGRQRLTPLCCVRQRLGSEVDNRARAARGQFLPVGKLNYFTPRVKFAPGPCRAPGLPSLRLACLAHARFPAPCTRAHACTARSTRTLHACEPRQQRAHALTQQHALTRQKHHVVPRVTGHWPLDSRPPP